MNCRHKRKWWKSDISWQYLVNKCKKCKWIEVRTFERKPMFDKDHTLELNAEALKKAVEVAKANSLFDNK